MRLARIEKKAARKAWGCPLTRNRTNWCYRSCEPVEGRGRCGRIAPHGLLGRTQAAILALKGQP